MRAGPPGPNNDGNILVRKYHALLPLYDTMCTFYYYYCNNNNNNDNIIIIIIIIRRETTSRRNFIGPYIGTRVPRPAVAARRTRPGRRRGRHKSETVVRQYKNVYWRATRYTGAEPTSSVLYRYLHTRPVLLLYLGYNTYLCINIYIYMYTHIHTHTHINTCSVYPLRAGKRFVVRSGIYKYRV